MALLKIPVASQNPIHAKSKDPDSRVDRGLDEAGASDGGLRAATAIDRTIATRLMETTKYCDDPRHSVHRGSLALGGPQTDSSSVPGGW